MGAVGHRARGVGADGKAIGTDFTSFWAASKLALQGETAAAYDVAARYAPQRAALGGRKVSPTLFCGAACWAAWRRLIGPEPGELAFAAFPAILVNVSHEQNAFLRRHSLRPGLLLLDKRRVLAGSARSAREAAARGHVAVLFIAGRRWTALVASTAAAVALCLTATAVFGSDALRAFAREALEAALVGADELRSV